MPFMPKEFDWTYSIILPAHNEEKFIGHALNSIVNQTHKPLEVVVVNDNSTDQTAEIVAQFSREYQFVRMVNSGSSSDEHLPGAKIIQAFYAGFNSLEKDWKLIVKMDADVVLPTDYFEKIIMEFATNPTVGIAGGLAYVEKNGEWVYEKIGNKKQVRGPFKTYSKPCFEKIGGLKNSIGWDTVDELLARYHGFQIQVLPELKVKLQKPTGVNYKAIHASKTGQAFYRMDYGIGIATIAALKVAWNKKKPLGFFQIMKAYLRCVFNSETKIVTKEEGKFIRNYRWKGIFSRLFFN